MTRTSSTIYRTSGISEPAPFGLFEDQYSFTASNGAEFRLWSEEADHLFAAIHIFQWDRQRIPLPELQLVTEWNMCKGVFDIGHSPTTVSDVARFIDALRVLRQHYADFESDGKSHGIAALSKVDLDALICFFVDTQVHNHTVQLSEH